MTAKRQIFRPEALERYTRSRERAVLPRLVRPEVTRFVWLLAFLLALAIAAGAAARVPEFVSAPAVVVSRGERAPTLVIFLDSADAPGIRPGAPVSASFGSGGPGRWVVRTLEPDALSPAAAAARLGPVALPDAARRRPAVLAWAVPEAPTRAATHAEGTVVHVRVRAGERRLIALLGRGKGKQ